MSEASFYGPSKSLIADLDGTVVQCGKYYIAAEKAVAGVIAQHTGMDAVHVRELFQYLDLFAIKTCSQGGFQRDRFPKSAAASALVAQALSAGQTGGDLPRAAYEVANSVFNAPYEPFPYAIDTLKAYKDAGWRVFIYTKGDFDVQMRKIHLHGIDQVVDGIQVVPRKDIATLREFCTTNLVDISSSVYVGDSERDDIAPAVALGLTAVRIATRPEDEWAYNPTTEYSDAKFYLQTLNDMLGVIPPSGTP